MDPFLEPTPPPARRSSPTRNETSRLPAAAVAMTHAMRRSAACRGKPAAAETIHGAHLPSALRKALARWKLLLPRATALAPCANALGRWILHVFIAKVSRSR